MAESWSYLMYTLSLFPMKKGMIVIYQLNVKIKKSIRQEKHIISIPQRNWSIFVQKIKK